MRRRLLVTCCGLLWVCGWGLSQEPPGKPPAQGQPATPPVDLSQDQEAIARKYSQLERTLLSIAQKLEKSGSAEAVRKANVIRKALDEAKNKGISLNLNHLAEVLRKPSLNDLKKAMDHNKDVTADLQQLLLDLLSDSEAEQIEFLKALLKELNLAILQQKWANTKNQSQNVDKDDAAKAQDAAMAKTQEILQRIQQYEAKMGRGKPQGEPKDGQEGKDKKDGKQDDKKDKGGKDQNKEGQKDDKSRKDAKGDSKDGKDGKESKSGGKESKDGKEGKDGGKESKEGKDSGKESKEDKDGKSEDKDQKPDQKGDGQDKPQENKGQPKKGQQGQKGQKGQGGEGGDENEDEQQRKQQQQQQEEQESVPGRERIKDANNDQKNAGDKIGKNRRTEAVPDQEDATRKLEEARKRLEEILRQKREEERERILADLKERCEKMKRMQEVVKENTEQLHKKVLGRPDRKPTRELELASSVQADEEDKIIVEADKAIAIIETEGSAVVFAEVFKQVRNDMFHVSRRLSRTDVGPQTQVIETDIINTLQEMIDALKRQIKQNLDRNDNPPPPPQNDQLKNLIDLIAELRMVRSLQMRVNNRTELWGKQYQGELAAQPEIIEELRDLAQRQHKLYQMTDNLAKGRNR